MTKEQETDLDTWRRLALATGGVALVTVGGWCLTQGFVWITAKFAALVNHYQTLLAALLHIGALFGALAFLALVAWLSSSREELPEGQIRPGEDHLDVVRRVKELR